MIIFFYSENDDKCKKMLNNLNIVKEELIDDEYDITSFNFYMCDIEKNEELIDELGIFVTPALKVFEKGVQIYTIYGLINKQDLYNDLLELI
jgi:thiol-disulfide isomerase/thioredoxin